MADKDYLKLMKDKEDEQANKDLADRMDADRELFDLKKESLTDAKGNNIPNTIFITLNQPAVFAANTETALNSASEQIVVESNNPEFDTAYVERFLRACFRSSDYRRTLRGDFPLNPYIDQQMCRRGGAFVRCVCQVKDSKDIEGKSIKEFVPNIDPWDRRYASCELGPEGIVWAGNRSPSRSRDKIIADYPDLEGQLTNQTYAVRDIWTPEKNLIYIDDILAVEQPHPFTYTPVLQQIVTLGSMLTDSESFKARGESILFLIRDLIPELNRLVSIIQNLNMKALDRAKVWKSKDAQQEPPDYSDIDDPGKVLAAETGGGPENVPLGQLTREAYLLHSMIEAAIQKGSLSDIEAGTLNFQLSAVALVEIGEGRDKVFLPRLGSRGMLNTAIAEMIIDQAINCGETKIMVGTRRQKEEFDVNKLKEEFSVDFRYFIKSPKIDAARVSLAAAYGNLIPDFAKRREILVREDPVSDELMLRWEQAEMISPAVRMNRTVKALLELADRGDEDARLEAEIMSAEMGVTLEQVLSGNIQPSQGNTMTANQQPQQIVPMFGNKVGPQTSALKAPGTTVQPAESEGATNEQQLQ